MNKKQLQPKKFKNEKEDFEFWSNLDLSEHFTKKDTNKVSFPNLKPTTKPISIRLPVYVIDAVKVKANKMDVPYQSLIKQAIIKEYVSG